MRGGQNACLAFFRCIRRSLFFCFLHAKLELQQCGIVVF